MRLNGRRESSHVEDLRGILGKAHSEMSQVSTEEANKK